MRLSIHHRRHRRFHAFSANTPQHRQSLKRRQLSWQWSSLSLRETIPALPKHWGGFSVPSKRNAWDIPSLGQIIPVGQNILCNDPAIALNRRVKAQTQYPWDFSSLIPESCRCFSGISSQHRLKTRRKHGATSQSHGFHLRSNGVPAQINKGRYCGLLPPMDYNGQPKP